MCTEGPLCKCIWNLYSINTFLGAFVTKVGLYVWILRLLIPIYPPLWTFFLPLYVQYGILHNPKNHDLRARGQCTKKFVFCFSTLLDGLVPILTLFLLKMQKESRKSVQSTQYGICLKSAWLRSGYGVGCPRKWLFEIPRNTEFYAEVTSIPRNSAEFRGIPRKFRVLNSAKFRAFLYMEFRIYFCL
jgi:hypothetical protein